MMDLRLFCFAISSVTWLLSGQTPAFAKTDSSLIWQEMADNALLRDPKRALIFGEKALRASGTRKQFALRNYEILAEASIRLFHPDQAFSYLFRAMEIAAQLKIKPAEIRCLILMGRLNWIMEDAEKANYYFSEAAKQAASAGDLNLQLQAEAFESFQKIQRNPPGSVSDYEKVKEFLDFVSIASVDTQLIAKAANLMGNVAFLHKSDADLAIRYYRQAVLQSEQSGDVFMAANYGQNLAEMYLSKENYPAAETILNEILSTARRINSDLLVYSCLKFLSACAAGRMDYRKAYELQTASEDLKSRHLNESQQLRTNDILQAYMQKKKEIQQKELENARLSARIEAEKRLRSYQIYLLGFLLAMLILIAFVVSNRRRISKIKKESKLAEEQKARLELLNAELVRQTGEAQKSREIAESAVRAKADFLSVITHELRTPIHAVMTASHLLEDSLNSPKTRNNLEILRISAENLHSLINNVLDFNKIESGKIELEPKPFSFQDLLRDIQMSFAPQAEEKGLDLQFRVDRNLPSAFIGDRLRLGQILNNLLSNAIKFTHTGFVHVEVRYQNAQGPAGIQVSVADTGIGIQKEEKEKIFGFFTQGNAGISVRYGGSGLGIPIASRLLQLMDSELSLQSEEGKGSVFSFVLHLPETDGLFLRSEAGSASGFDFSKFRVLFVDDVEYNRILVQHFFEKWHLSFDFALTGEQALGLARTYAYDLILLDIRLPDANGFNLAVTIREMEGYQNVPILAMTASDRNEIAKEIIESSMQDFLGKPFTPEDLRIMLEKWLIRAE